MASTPGYQPRVRVNVGRADPVAGPNRAIADGIAELGGALGRVAEDRRNIEEARRASQYRIEVEQQRRDRSAMIADRAGAWAAERGALHEELEEAKSTTLPGAPDWPDRAKKIVDNRMSKFLDTLGDDEEVRQRFEPMVVNWGVATIERELDWARSKKAEHEGNSLKAWHDQRVLEVEERGDFQAAFDDYDVLLDGMDMDATRREQLRLVGKQEFVERGISTQIAGGNIDGARAALNNDSMKPFLTPESRERLFGEVGRAEARAAVEAERAESEKRDAARQTVKTIQALLDAGAEPTPAQMKELAAASALLPPDEQVEVAAIDTQLAVNRATRGRSAEAIRRERDRLRAKVEAGRASQTEQMMLQSYDARLGAAEDSEAEDMRMVLGEGTAGRIAAVERMQGQDAASRFAVLEKAAPGLGHVSLLRTATNRRMAVEGAEIRKAQKDLVPEKEAKAAFRRNIGSVAAIVGEDYDDKLAIAMDLYAHHVSRSPQKSFNNNLFWQYTNIAFGATKRRDGSWQGGLGTVNGVRTVLPDNVSQAEFRAALARTDWSHARDEHRQAVPKSFITGQMYPVLVEENARNSVYHLRDRSGRVLLGPKGGALRWTVANGVGR